jgi:hypothetical protein
LFSQILAGALFAAIFRSEACAARTAATFMMLV